MIGNAIAGSELQAGCDRMEVLGTLFTMYGVSLAFTMVKNLRFALPGPCVEIRV